MRTRWLSLLDVRENLGSSSSSSLLLSEHGPMAIRTLSLFLPINMWDMEGKVQYTLCVHFYVPLLEHGEIYGDGVAR